MEEQKDLLKDYHDFLGNIDFSKIKAQTKGSPKYLAEKVGLYLIDKAINRVLHNYTDQYFFEYSLLPSAINPKTGKLLSFAGIRTEDPVFEQRVGKYVSPIINKLYPSSTNRAKGYSDAQKVDLLATNWFHNPEMFLFPTINSVEPFHVSGAVNCPESNKDYIISVEGNTQSSFNTTDETNLYFSNLSYARTIDEMLGASRMIIQKLKESNQSDQYPLVDLLRKYHEGARRLKANYDHYFVTDASQYDYITFPILSTRNDDIGHYYSNIFLDAIPNDAHGLGHVAGMGHFFLYLRKTSKRKICKRVINDLFLEINKVLCHIALNYVYSTGITLMQNMRKDAVKAAIAQVMARNMSHNFGSHVLSNLIGTSTYEMVKDENMDPNSESRVESNIKYGYNSFYEDNQTKPVFGAKKEYNRQLPAFFQYLKSRMDYLNEVTFNVTTFVTSRLVREDLMKELDRVRILLNTISGVGDFRYSFRLLHNGERITKENDFRAAFPADVLGCQAFYNILENIIRNTAKHAKVPEGKEVVFTIDFEDSFDLPEDEDYYLVKVFSDVRDDDILGLVTDQKERLNESILDSRNNLRNRSLGLLEMEASAAFLRQIDLTEIESDDYEVDDHDYLFHKRKSTSRLNILKPYAVDPQPTGKIDKRRKPICSGSLGYRFFVQKPKDFLFVGDWTLDSNQGRDAELKKVLRNKGILFYKEKEFTDSLESKLCFPHSFVIFDYQPEISSYEASLSLRLIKNPDQEIKGELVDLLIKQEKDPFDNLENYVWKLYGTSKGWPAPTDIYLTSETFAIDRHCVIFSRHPFLDIFVEEYLKKPHDKTIEAAFECLPSLRQGKMPKFGQYSRGGEEDDAKGQYLDSSRGVPSVVLPIYEAYHYPVIIIDERVQQFAEENKETELPCWALHYTTNVFIPRRPGKDKEGRVIAPPTLDGIPLDEKDIIPLDPKAFTDEITNKLIDYIELHLKNHPGASLLIHYGILERMYNGVTSDIRNKLVEWAGKAQRVLVTSGRGAHSIELPDSVCFVNLSSVLYACNENRNKYLIYNLIVQSRRKQS